MSKRTNNRFTIVNKDTNQIPFRKCSHHIHSYYYAANIKQHDELMEKLNALTKPDIDNSINIIVVLHFLAPRGSFNKNRVLSRAHDIIQSLNDDFNNYSTNTNTMNNFKYKSIINQVFLSNMSKQNTYLGNEYLKFLPTKPSNITFELGEIYYYPIKNKLTLGPYDDFKNVEIEHQTVKQYIYQNRADAIKPENFLNIWIIDMADTSILAFSNFPWEIMDNYHGVCISRRCFFPEDYGEINFNLFKTITHAIGHFLGLLHVMGNDTGIGAYAASNINADTEQMIENNIGDYIAETPQQFHNACDPTDKDRNRRLHTDKQYNPLFMNFMDYTHDKFVCMFTQNQIRKMRLILATYRPNINSLVHKEKLPVAKYNPETDTVFETVEVSKKRKHIRYHHMNFYIILDLYNNG